MTSSTENFPDDRHAADGGVATSHTAWTRGRAIVSICLIVGGLLYLFAAFGLDRGDLAHPGPGLFPILIGGLAVVAGILGLLELREGHELGTHEVEVVGKKPWIFIGTMAFAVILLPTVGYFVSALAGGAAVSWAAGQKVWWKALLTGLGIALVSSIIFRMVLEVPLPSSIIDEVF